MRTVIRSEIELIAPFDAIESSHRNDALAWIDSGVELCRRERPATPPKHLVSYVVVVDAWEILLVDHKNARLWLPPGGHVEPDEHPRFTVERELKEELGLAPPHPVGPPLFITCTETIGQTAGHIDVSLWYLVRAEVKDVGEIDGSEFEAARWFPFAEVPHGRSDPHLLRFLRKYRS